MPDTTMYVVRKGDTLGVIAKRFYGRMGAYTLIVAANRIRNPDHLRVGQELVIPSEAPSPDPVTLEPVTRPYAAVSAQRLGTLHPRLAQLGVRLLDQCAAAGLALMVTQGLRTMAEQNALYAQGRTAPGKIVTNARGGQSYHNFGLAFDVLVLDAMGKAQWSDAHPGWRQAGLTAEALGLEWGGHWTGLKDLPHFQYTGGLGLERCRSLVASGLEAVWAEVH
jgi:D-alanyl-D-alanine carboxypeptidase/LysM domain